MSQVVSDPRGNAFELRPIACPTCGPTEEVELGYRGGEYQRWGLGAPTRIVQCRSCSLVFPNPFPFPKDPQKLYGDPEKYFATHTLELKIESYRKLVRSLISRSGLTQPRLLDVGSGRGDLPHAAKLEGLQDVLGLEFSQAMIEFARERFGVELSSSTLDDLVAANTAPFDIVVLNAVLEHVHDPDAFIAAVARLTKPSSVLYIDIPQEPNLLTTIGNWTNRLRGSKAVYNLAPTWPPYHVYGFNPHSLRRLLGKHGFEIVELTIHANPTIRASKSLGDRAKSLVGTQIRRIANLTGTASNMYVHARRTDHPRA